MQEVNKERKYLVTKGQGDIETKRYRDEEFSLIQFILREKY